MARKIDEMNIFNILSYRFLAARGALSGVFVDGFVRRVAMPVGSQLVDAGYAIRGNRALGVMMGSLAACVIVLVLLWVGSASVSAQRAADTAALREQTATYAAREGDISGQHADLLEQNALLEAELGALEAAVVELEAQNGDLSKKFSALSSPS